MLSDRLEKVRRSLNAVFKDAKVGGGQISDGLSVFIRYANLKRGELRIYADYFVGSLRNRRKRKTAKNYKTA